MNYRILKKKNTFNRCQYIANKIGTVEIGIWVEYFKKHPTDLPKVLKNLHSQWFRSSLKKYIRTNYHNPSFDSKRCDWVIWQLENGYFGQYMKLSMFARFYYNLTDIPISKENPYGINEHWRGVIRSTGVKRYEVDN